MAGCASYQLNNRQAHAAPVGIDRYGVYWQFICPLPGDDSLNSWKTGRRASMSNEAWALPGLRLSSAQAVPFAAIFLEFHCHSDYLALSGLPKNF